MELGALSFMDSLDVPVRSFYFTAGAERYDLHREEQLALWALLLSIELGLLGAKRTSR